MKKILLSIILLQATFLGVAQEKTIDESKTCDKKACCGENTYYTAGGEWVFSMADTYINGIYNEGPVRFSPILNVNIYAHHDFTDHFGFFHGLGIRNVGFIQERQDLSATLNDAPVKTKHRSYNATIPLGFKVGDVDKFFFYAGYEFEYAFNYREKLIIGDEKENDENWWFSERVNRFQHGFFVGVQLPWDMNIKFKYYVSEFFNQGYTDYTSTGVAFNPYEGFRANVYSVSLDFSMLKREEMGHHGMEGHKCTKSKCGHMGWNHDLRDNEKPVEGKVEEPENE